MKAFLSVTNGKLGFMPLFLTKKTAAFVAHDIFIIKYYDIFIIKHYSDPSLFRSSAIADSVLRGIKKGN